MNQFEIQTDILNKLCQIIHDEANFEYDFAICEYEYFPEYDTISTSFKTIKDGNEKYIEMSVGAPSRNAELAFELRYLMKAHTGGEWTSFTLTLDKDGKAHTKFHYPEPKA